METTSSSLLLVHKNNRINESAPVPCATQLSLHNVYLYAYSTIFLKNHPILFCCI